MLRCLFFFVPFGLAYLAEKKLVPGDAITVVYCFKVVLYMGFMMLYLTVYPRIYFYFHVHTRTDIILPIA